MAFDPEIFDWLGEEEMAARARRARFNRFVLESADPLFVSKLLARAKLVLRPRQYVYFNLRYGENLRYREIAEVENVNPRTVARIMLLAERNMRKEWGKS